jgi:hypothetical protein
MMYTIFVTPEHEANAIRLGVEPSKVYRDLIDARERAGVINEPSEGLLTWRGTPIGQVTYTWNLIPGAVKYTVYATPAEGVNRAALGVAPNKRKRVRVRPRGSRPAPILGHRSDSRKGYRKP